MKIESKIINYGLIDKKELLQLKEYLGKFKDERYSFVKINDFKANLILESKDTGYIHTPISPSKPNMRLYHISSRLEKRIEFFLKKHPPKNKNSNHK